MPMPIAPHLAGQPVVVTGAAGFIGSAIVRRLVSELGCSVTGIDDERTGDWARVDDRCNRRVASIESLSVEEWSDLIGDAEVVFHLAAEKYNSSKSTPERLLEANVSAFQRLIAGAQHTESKVVFTSSLYAYGSMGPAPMRETDVPAPITLYGASKVMGEHMLRAAERRRGLRWSVGRLFFVYGPDQFAEGGYKSVIPKNFERIADGRSPTIFGDGEQALDYVYIDDCIDALLGLTDAGADGAIANVASGRAVSIKELTERMLGTAGSELKPAYEPPDWTAGSMRSGSNDLIKEVIGWQPTTNLEEGLERVWNSYRTADARDA